MAKFIVTKHAAKRMKERDVKDPNGRILINAGRKSRKRIRETCKKNGCDQKEYIYLISNRFDNKKDVSVYICKAIGIGKYLLITVFKYFRNEKKED